MLLQAVCRAGLVRQHVLRHVYRNFGISAVCTQKGSSITDPIQQLFLDKIREYKTKSAGGKLVDASPTVQTALKEEIERIDRVFNAKGKDMTQFPTFVFKDPLLDPVGLGDTKDLEVEEKEEVLEEEEEDNKPYFTLP